MSGLEKKSLIQAILVLLDSLPRCVVIKRWGTPAALTDGEPDITALIRGRHLELTVRGANDPLTARERARREEWESAGAIVATVSSADELRRVLREYGIA